MSSIESLQGHPRRWLLAAVAVLVAGVVAAPADAQPPEPPAEPSQDQAITDPIPADPIPAALGLVLAELGQFPQSEPVPRPTDPRLDRWARINYLREAPDGSGRMFVPDLNGNLYVIDGGPPQVYLDVAATFAPDFWSGRGLGSGFGFVTFHPEFAGNGRFYTVHSEAFDALETKPPDLTAQPDPVIHSVVTEWTTADPSAATFSGTRREVLRLAFATYIHAIQQIDFNPAAQPGDEDYGLLYLAVGDGGIGVSTSIPQDLSAPYGKLLRIDPMGTNSANGRYGVPSSNPFVETPGALGEIYAYGMRDPHRFSWDTGAGNRLLLGHIGEHAIEGVYEVRAGDNLGWSEREGPFVFNRAEPCHLYPLPADDARFGYTYPVAAYDHDPPPGWPCDRDSGHAISGGFVYRGGDLPELRGKYVFADLVDGRVLYTESQDMDRGQPLAPIHQLSLFDASSGEPVTMPELAGDPRVDLRFGVDRRGELYLLAKANGMIWKVTGTRSTGSAQPAPVLAFPGAEGFGANASGGRGGDVYYVTNLADSGPGSFRDAVSQPNRTVVFAVGGIIEIDSRISVAPNTTIAGQTAPGDGITIYGDGLSFTGADNTIVRYLRVRQGVGGTSGADAVTVADGDTMIFDHMSVSWGRDENFSASAGDLNKPLAEQPQNITIQNCIISQGLDPHSAGSLIESAGPISVVRNLYADNNIRSVKSKGKSQYVNNVVYNWRGEAYILGGSAFTSHANIEGSYFIAGPETASPPFVRGNANFNLYANQNFHDNNLNGSLDGYEVPRDEYTTVTWRDEPFPYPDVTRLSPQDAYHQVLATAGASRHRDRIDRLIVDEVRSLGTDGAIISDENAPPINGPGPINGGTAPPDGDADGMPDEWERSIGLDPDNPDNNGDQNGDGYTNLEEYLNSLVP